MLSRIAELNTLPDVNKVSEGADLLVPHVPTVGRKYNSPPNAWVGQNVKTALAWTGNAVADTASSKSAPPTAAPQEEVQYFTVPLSEAAKYLLPGHAAQGASGPMQVDLSLEPATVLGSQVLTEVTASLIKTKLSSAWSGPRPVVIIVDDSVPDNQEYAATKVFLTDISKTVRETYKLGDSPYASEIEALPSLMPAESPDSLFPNLKTHSSLIKQSLLEFVALDTGSRISVIYVPLGATQIGVAPLLKELVYLAQLLKIVRPTLPPAITASQIQRTQAKAATEVIVAGNPAAFQYGVLMPLDGSELSVTTDSLLLEAIGIVISYYTDAARRPYWLSFSWTAPKFVFPTYFEAATYGMKFVAAGNQKKPLASADFLQLELEYASRAATSQDFVVVMNSTGAAVGCPSNLFNDEGLNVATVAYPGNATDKYCGTSFSTPRAAWLAAARESALGQRIAPPISKQGKLAWLGAQHAAILTLKQATQSDIFGRYSLDVKQFFSK